MGSLSNNPSFNLNGDEVATIIAALTAFTALDVRSRVASLAMMAAADPDHVLHGTELIDESAVRDLVQRISKQLRFKGSPLLLFLIV